MPQKQVRVAQRMSDFKTPAEAYDFEKAHWRFDPSANKSDGSCVLVTCHSDDLLYFSGATCYDLVELDDQEEPEIVVSTVDGYESVDPISKELPFALIGEKDGERHGCVVCARLGGLPGATGWRLSFGLLDGEGGVPMPMPEVRVMVNAGDSPIWRRGRDGEDDWTVFCHFNPLARIEIVGATVIPLDALGDHYASAKSLLADALASFVKKGSA